MPFTPTAPLLKKASKSSTLWLARQYKDPYVRARLSNPVNYRSRSAFKLLEVEARFKFLNDFLKEARRSMAAPSTSSNHNDDRSNGTKARRVKQRTFNVVDLGAAPGGWSQVIAAKLGLAGDELDEDPSIHARRKPKSNMAEWKEEMSKRKKMSKMFDEHVEEEIADTDQLVHGEPGADADEWSTPPPSNARKQFGLKKETEEAEYDSMDPLDYLNSRDLDRPSASTSTAQKHALPINVVALDILAMRPLAGVHAVQMNFLSPEAPNAVMSLLAKLNETHTGKALSPTRTRVDLMLSDLSPPHTGNRTADVSHSVTLLRAVWDFARKTLKTRHEYHLERIQQAQWIRQDVERECGLTGTGQEYREDYIEDEVKDELERAKGQKQAKSILRNGGILVLKHFAHPLSTSFCRVFLNPYFFKILYFKPPSSRNDSSEGYWVCIGWRGVPDKVTMEQLEERMQRDVEKEMAKESLQEEEPEEAEDRRGREYEMGTDVAAAIGVDSSSLMAKAGLGEAPGTSGPASVSEKDNSAPDASNDAVTNTSTHNGSAEESLPTVGEVIDWRPKHRQT